MLGAVTNHDEVRPEMAVLYFTRQGQIEDIQSSRPRRELLAAVQEVADRYRNLIGEAPDLSSLQDQLIAPITIYGGDERTLIVRHYKVTLKHFPESSMEAAAAQGTDGDIWMADSHDQVNGRTGR